MDITLYPDNWIEISHYIRFERAGGQCECTGECGQHNSRCQARHGEPHPGTGSRVVLTTAHLNHDTSDNQPDNLRAMCQKCHLVYDQNMHMQHARETRNAARRTAAHEAGQMELF
jgi:hypothetical protein